MKKSPHFFKVVKVIRLDIKVRAANLGQKLVLNKDISKLSKQRAKNTLFYICAVILFQQRASLVLHKVVRLKTLGGPVNHARHGVTRTLLLTKDVRLYSHAKLLLIPELLAKHDKNFWLEILSRIFFY